MGKIIQYKLMIGKLLLLLKDITKVICPGKTKTHSNCNKRLKDE